MATDYTIPKDEYRALVEERDKLFALLKHESEQTEKLRELVRNLLRVLPRDISGVVIGAHGEHPTYYSFADAMRELGVEVSE